MAIAALIISGVAAAAAVLAMLAARRSARAAARTVQIDEERRHDERAPVFSARYGQASWDDGEPEDVDVVWFDYLAGPGTLASVIVRLIMRTDAHEPVFSNIAAPDGEWSDRVELADPFDVEIGTETLIRVTRPQERPSDDAVFVLHCRAGIEEWEVPVRCEIPQGTSVVSD
jgi:hypothetical protein